MRPIVAGVLSAVISSGASAHTVSASYWLFLQGDGHTWCRYTDEAKFTSDVKELKPAETVRATYSAAKLVKLTYQVEPGGLTLRRANLLAQQNLQIVEETSIQGGKAKPFRLLSTTTLDGKKAAASTVDLPDVSVRTSFFGTPLLEVVSETERQSVSKLCKGV